MKKMIAVLIFLMPLPLSGVGSFVYNLRIAETTKRALFEQPHRGPSLLSTALIGQLRKKYDGSTRTFGGALGTYTYAPSRYYFRVDCAGARVSSDIDHVHYSRAQADDVLFSGGYFHSVSDRAKATFSGLLGIPTHGDTSLEHVQLGYGHVGLGAQVDGSYLVTQGTRYSLRPAFRIIHFFKRSVPVINEVGRFSFTPGNLIDLFLAFHIHEPHFRFEVGYDLTILCRAKINPRVASIAKQTDYIRSSFYGTYKHRFLLWGHQSAITFALSGGFDHRPKLYGFRRILTTWGLWEINF